MLYEVITAAVIEVGRHPAVGGVAQIAGVVAGDVVRRLAGGGGAVVTTEAGADHVIVIDPDHRHPGGVAMAVLAHIVGRNVGRILAGGGGAVVAAGAVGRGAGVIEGRRYPGVGGVAQIAGVA